MNKKAIADTALCRFDEQEGCFIVESPLMDRIIGVHEQESEAWRLFHELLDETYVAYLEGKLVGYDKRGRPAKGNVEFHAQIKPELKAQIVEKAKELGISQGEVIAYLAAAAEAKEQVEKRLKALEQRMQQCETQHEAAV